MPAEAVPALNQPLSPPRALPLCCHGRRCSIVVAGRRGQVAAATGSIGNGRTTAGVDIDIGAVVDGAAVNGRPRPRRRTEVTNPYRVPLVAAGVDLVDDHDAAIGTGASQPHRCRPRRCRHPLRSRTGCGSGPSARRHRCCRHRCRRPRPGCRYRQRHHRFAVPPPASILIFVLLSTLPPSMEADPHSP